MTVNTEDIDRQIKEAENRAAELRQLKSQQQAAADAVWRQSQIAQAQDEWVAKNRARLTAISDQFITGPLATVQATAAAQSEAEAAFLAECTRLDELVAQVRAMTERLEAEQSKLLNGRNASVLALARQFLAYAWADWWANVNPAQPDAAALTQFKAWASGLFAGELTSPHLGGGRTNETIVRFHIGSLKIDFENRRASRTWADSTWQSEQDAAKRAAEMKRLGLG